MSSTEPVKIQLGARRERIALMLGVLLIAVAGLPLYWLSRPQVANARVQVLAHRGASAYAPENTLAAFRLAIAQHADWLELDVQQTKDGHLVVFHDLRIDRTTNGQGNLRDLTLERTTNGIGRGGDQPWDQLARLDAGSWHSRGHAGEPLPTFENIARFCLANRFLLDVEIKPTPGLERETGEVVARHAARLWAGAAVPPLLTSFRPESLQAAQAAQPELPRGLLLDTLWEGWFDIARSLDCMAIVCNHALWDAPTVARVQGAGMRCLSYTVNEEWAAQRLLALGTDGIVTDRVDLFAPA